MQPANFPRSPSPSRPEFPPWKFGTKSGCQGVPGYQLHPHLPPGENCPLDPRRALGGTAPGNKDELGDPFQDALSLLGSLLQTPQPTGLFGGSFRFVGSGEKENSERSLPLPKNWDTGALAPYLAQFWHRTRGNTGLRSGGGEQRGEEKAKEGLAREREGNR